MLVTLKYIGTHYHGWQMQKNATTVQDAFMPVLYRILGERVDIKGCSRTDTGVHANAYCVSFQTCSQIPCERLVLALNSHLPLDIGAVSCVKMPLDFHARYSVKAKEYIYKIHNAGVRDPFLEGLCLRYPQGRLDEAAMEKMAQVLVGKHDFRSFCSTKSDQEDTTRTIYQIHVTRQGDMLTLSILGDGFCTTWCALL